MSNVKSNRPFRLSFNVDQAEYEKIKVGWSSTTCRNLSEYARKKMLNKLVTVKYRNQSFDDMTEELINLRNDLAQLLQLFQEKEKQLSSSYIASNQQAAIFFHNSLECFNKKQEEIKEAIIKLYDICLQK